MIPGVDDGAEDPTEEPSNSSNTLTFADPDDPDKTVSITLSDLKIDNVITNGLALKLSAKVVNDSETSVAFVTEYANKASGADDGNYQVVVSAYPDAVETSEDIVVMANDASASLAYEDNLLLGDTIASEGEIFSIATATSGTVTDEGFLYLAINDEELKWSKVTVKMDVYKILTKASTGTTDAKQHVKTLKFTFSK